MKESVRLIVTLTVICAVAGLVLAGVYDLTREPIAGEKRRETLAALDRVLPPHDNQPDLELRRVPAGNREWLLYPARKAGVLAGAACRGASDKGYGGDIVVMVGLTAVGEVRGVEIVEHAETPGLGSKIAAAGFLGQFRDRGGADPSWCALRRDGGEIQAVTGATISSRAVIEAVRRGLELYAARRPELRAGGGRDERP